MVELLLALAILVFLIQIAHLQYHRGSQKLKFMFTAPAVVVDLLAAVVLEADMDLVY
jgi:hypothetical protein